MPNSYGRVAMSQYHPRVPQGVGRVFMPPSGPCGWMVTETGNQNLLAMRGQTFMKASTAIGAMIFGGVLIAISAVFFFGAQDGLAEIEAARGAAGGLGGFLIEFTDALGATNIEEAHQRLIWIRGFSIGGIAIGIGIILLAVFYRDQSPKN